MILITAISKYVINYNYIIVCPKPRWAGSMNTFIVQKDNTTERGQIMYSKNNT